MQLLRWNNPGAGHQASLFHGERGWMSRNKTCASGGGRKMFLTSPFIDQAFALKTPVTNPDAVEYVLNGAPAGIVYCCFAKYFSNKSCDRCAPSSVSSTDFAFV